MWGDTCKLYVRLRCWRPCLHMVRNAAHRTGMKVPSEERTLLRRLDVDGAQPPTPLYNTATTVSGRGTRRTPVMVDSEHGVWCGGGEGLDK